MNESSIRLRVRRSEVERFARESEIESVTVFPGGRVLRVRLSVGDVPQSAVSFDGELLEVRMPPSDSARWTTAGEVGIYAKHGPMEILIEKDFRRTSQPSPDDDDRYPNPRAAG
jgi:hypothetical protein